jgi:LMBR1 domain-containing protein 1
MNSFLFNVSLMLLTSVSVTQFCSASFRDYVTMTDIDLIFSTQIRYLKFFNFFYKYHVFEYAIFVKIIFNFFRE